MCSNVTKQPTYKQVHLYWWITKGRFMRAMSKFIRTSHMHLQITEWLLCPFPLKPSVCWDCGCVFSFQWDLDLFPLSKMPWPEGDEGAREVHMGICGRTNYITALVLFVRLWADSVNQCIWKNSQSCLSTINLTFLTRQKKTAGDLRFSFSERLHRKKPKVALKLWIWQLCVC